MTRQEVYDTLVKAARDGVMPCKEPGGKDCMYRNEYGNRCAAGIFMSEIELVILKELGQLYCSFSDIVNEVSTSVLSRTGLTINEMGLIQGVHDSLTGSNPWKADRFIFNLNGLRMFEGVRKIANEVLKG